MRKGKIHYAWIVLIGVLLIRGFASGGINMTAGLFLTPVAADIGIGVGTLSVYFSIMSIVTVLCLPIAGKLFHKYDVRVIAIVSACLQALSFAAFGYMKSVIGWYLLSIPQAMGASVVANILGPILINRWFVKHKGLLLGLQMAVVGIFGAILQQVTANVIAQNGWRYAYLLIGLLTFVVVVVSSLLFLRNTPEEKQLFAYGADKKTEYEKTLEKQNSTEQHKTVASENETAMEQKKAIFYYLLFFMIAITGVGVFTQHIPTYGGELGYDIGQTGTAMSCISIGTAVGAIFLGIVSDRIGSLKTGYMLMSVGFASVVGLWFGNAGLLVFYIASFLLGLVSSGIMVLAPILTIAFYGTVHYETMFAKVSMGAPIASVFLLPAYGYIYDFTQSYQMVLFCLSVLLIIASICISLGWRRRRFF